MPGKTEGIANELRVVITSLQRSCCEPGRCARLVALFAGLRPQPAAVVGGALSATAPPALTWSKRARRAWRQCSAPGSHARAPAAAEVPVDPSQAQGRRALFRRQGELVTLPSVWLCFVLLILGHCFVLVINVCLCCLVLLCSVLVSGLGRGDA